MTQEINLAQYDAYIESTDWLAETELPVAITLEEILEPAEGPDTVIFPPTFAVGKTAKHPYQIDVIHENLPAQAAARDGLEANICQIDSVGSQANRMEGRFKELPLSALVPQITVKLNDEVKANLLDVGHRVADGSVRFSGLRDDVTAAIKARRDPANAAPLARLAPTSLLFGFWDSRPDTTMYKSGRMLSSTIRATNVEFIKRSAQFNSTFDPAALGLADEIPEGEQDQQESSGKAADGKDPLSKLGLRHAPAVNTHGGIRVFGRIVRRTQINLVRLRSLSVPGNGEFYKEETLKLRRYMLGLALVAARIQTNYNLREGCLLRCVKAKPQLVYTTKENQAFDLTPTGAFKYCDLAARGFGVGSGREVSFDAKAARQGVEEVKKAATKKKK
ncbi:MAG: type I-U CRISPR-associated RAMP protein Csb1/Cas7u [Blastocatellia bacterium]